MIKEIGVGIGAIALLILIFVGLQFFGVWNVEFFGSKYAAAEREVWENTPSRIHGATQEITRRMYEYRQTNVTVEKKAICEMLRNQYPDITPDEIDDYTVRNFFEKCKYGG